MRLFAPCRFVPFAPSPPVPHFKCKDSVKAELKINDLHPVFMCFKRSFGINNAFLGGVSFIRCNKNLKTLFWRNNFCL